MNDFLQSLRNGQAEKPRTPKTRKNFDNSYQYSNNSRYSSYGGGGGYQNTRNQQMKRQPSQGMPHQGGNQIPAEDPSMTLLADILENLSSHVETLVKNQEYMVNIQERTTDMLERQTMAIESIVSHLNLSPPMEDNLTPGRQVEMNEQLADEQPAFENHYVTSREPEDNQEDNRGNGWAKPVAAPVPVAKPVAKPILKKAKKIQVKPQIKEVATSKPVLRKRRKVVAKEVVEPKINTTKAKSINSSNSSNSNTAKLMPRDAIIDIIQSMRDEGATFDQVAKRLVDLGQPTFSGRGEWHAQTIHRLCSKK